LESYQIQSLLEMLIISGSVLGGLAIAALTWVKTRAHIGGRKDVTRLTESVDGLRDSVEAMRAELGDMSDRLEFAERILGRISDICLDVGRASHGYDITSSYGHGLRFRHRFIHGHDLAVDQRQIGRLLLRAGPERDPVRRRPLTGRAVPLDGRRAGR